MTGNPNTHHSACQVIVLYWQCLCRAERLKADCGNRKLSVEQKCFFYSSSNASPSEGAPLAGGYGCTPNSLPKFQHPSHELLKENGFTQQVYHKYHRRCLTGKPLNVLPNFLARSNQLWLDSSFLHIVLHPSFFLGKVDAYVLWYFLFI